MPTLLKEKQIESSDADWIARVMTEQFASTRIVSRGMLYDSIELPGIIATTNSSRVGLAQYSIHDNEFEVVVLIALVQRQGIGKYLLNSMSRIAHERECSRIWLVTTNNNVTAIQFYEALGWRRLAIYKNVVETSRQLKPEIPKYDGNGVAIVDEIEYELVF